MTTAVTSTSPRTRAEDPANDSPVSQSAFLRAMHVYGLDHLEPVLLAALATEAPLLLIGGHGTAKSALLNRVAAALGLAHRHYNASLISFDDLLGFPVPNRARDAIEYLDIPESIWGAESVFLDEISRCRPEVQNKLFSVVHERRIQGRRLVKLRYRWAAMNPPMDAGDCATPGDEGWHDQYEGSLPLDPALADRFPFVVVVPGIQDFGRDDRLALITDGSCEALAGEGLRHLIERTRARLEAIDASERTWLGGYVEALIDPIGEAGWPITGRRASYLHANALAVAAACSALGNEASLEDAAFLAVKWSLPQRARGTAIDETKLAAVHRSALVQAGTPERSFWQSLRRIADPLERLARVVKTPASDVDVLEISALVSDLWAGFSLPQRYVLSRHVLPHLAAGSQVTVPCYEAIAEPVLAVQAFASGGTHKKDVARIKVPEHQHVITVARKLAERGEDGVQLGNTLLALLFGSDEPFDADTMVEFDRRCATLFGELAGQSARSEQAA